MLPAHLEEAGSSVAHARVTILQHAHKDPGAANALEGTPIPHDAAHKQQQQRDPQILHARQPCRLQAGLPRVRPCRPETCNTKCYLPCK